MDFTPVKLEQKFFNDKLEDIKSVVIREIENTDLPGKIEKGMKVALLVGSRGISNIPMIVRTAVETVRSAGGEPYLVAAMGSHGGGTAQGQRKVLFHLGISEDTIGCPVLCSAQSVLIGETKEGYPVYTNHVVRDFDGVLAVNRVKPHTSFKGEIESGLMKMLAVGLGGPKGASAVHALGARGLRMMVPSIAREVQRLLPVWGGLAIVENAYEKTFLIKGVGNWDIEPAEKELLVLAKNLMPSLPFSEIDVLVVEEIGKNYSGTGMDTNVINRMRIQGEPEPAGLDIKRIVVLDISEESHGNATGIGLADFTTKKLVNKIDFQATYLNCLTSTFIQRAMVPMTLDNEEDAIATAVKSLGCKTMESARIVRIANTLSMDCLQVSKSLLDDVEKDLRLEIIRK